MNRNRCECERSVAEALRTGVWTAELQQHVGGCAACEETRRVAGSLLRYASGLQVTVGGADAIWRRAQAERQAMALKRATRPLIFMRGLSVGCVVAFALWVLRGFSRIGYSSGYHDWMHGWAGAGVETAAVGVGIAMVCIGVGAFYMLREDRRRGVWHGAS
ncbi:MULTISPECIES: hypothetical protein [Acidobacteriaceae]|uniref:hypothetical protein n=1 Tax=Acidobacteriaceae TaxID=204434 RepID=UPI00131D4C3F|nr:MULTISPECIES: hypothetical protein [Acidobacteriaceae]MDW5265569.1 hypothetical protein [Edaphobacter sp.]